MNRLSFLKTLGVGVAAGVLAPKIVLDGLSKKEITAKCVKIEQEHYFTEYGHFEEDVHIVEHRVCLWDAVMSKDANVYMVTSIQGDIIGLTAAEADVTPNDLAVSKEYLGEYFVIISSAFGEGTGNPSKH